MHGPCVPFFPLTVYLRARWGGMCIVTICAESSTPDTFCIGKKRGEPLSDPQRCLKHAGPEGPPPYRWRSRATAVRHLPWAVTLDFDAQ